MGTVTYFDALNEKEEEALSSFDRMTCDDGRLTLLISEWIRLTKPRIGLVTEEDIYYRGSDLLKPEFIRVLVVIGDKHHRLNIDIEELNDEFFKKREKQNNEYELLAVEKYKNGEEVKALKEEIALLKKQLNPKKDIKTQGVHISQRIYKDEVHHDNF